MEHHIVMFILPCSSQVIYGPFASRREALAWEDGYADAPKGSQAYVLRLREPQKVYTAITVES